jgi:hypothetical protein
MGREAGIILAENKYSINLNQMIMKRIFMAGLMLALLAPVLLISCKKECNDAVERDFTFSGFTKIDAGNMFHFNITRGSSFAIRAKGCDDDLNDLVMKVENGTLKMEYSRYEVDRKRVNFNVTMPVFEGAVFSGQSKAWITGFNPVVPVNLNVSGQAFASFNGTGSDFFLRTSGQSKIEMTGTATNIDADASGQSEIYAYPMSATNARADATGQSTIKVKVSASLTAAASGQSKIYYQGNPPVKNITSTGQSKVIAE